MAYDRANHPCLRCTLPDCDDRNLGCELRKILNAYYRARNDAAAVSAALKREYAIAYREIHGLNRDVKRAEARMERASA
jgi:hypothetical protein